MKIDIYNIYIRFFIIFVFIINEFINVIIVIIIIFKYFISISIIFICFEIINVFYLNIIF